VHFDLLSFTETRPKKNQRYRSVRDFHDAYRGGSTTPAQAIEKLLEIVAKSNGQDATALNAIVKYDAAAVRAAAKKSTERYKIGKPLSALDGVPICVKVELGKQSVCVLVLRI
jgi:Asp-tRNA(Asn)/Glu-tRNA(Gln) amidotransferase A subunit family amidase